MIKTIINTKKNSSIKNLKFKNLRSSSSPSNFAGESPVNLFSKYQINSADS